MMSSWPSNFWKANQKHDDAAETGAGQAEGAEEVHGAGEVFQQELMVRISNITRKVRPMP